MYELFTSIFVLFFSLSNFVGVIVVVQNIFLHAVGQVSNWLSFQLFMLHRHNIGHLTVVIINNKVIGNQTLKLLGCPSIAFTSQNPEDKQTIVFHRGCYTGQGHHYTSNPEENSIVRILVSNADSDCLLPYVQQRMEISKAV